MEKQIFNLLDEIEKKHDIEIVLAIESGSRAWGFPSSDSDYDIRFIYHHKMDWYITPFEKPNVIDQVFIGDLDASGWDVAKCLRLLRKGNAQLYEWLYSPVVYSVNEDKLAPLGKLAEEAHNPKTSFYHYISMAKKKLLDESTRTNPKSFLYALRALLCAKWLVEGLGIAPVDFFVLTDKFITEPSLKNSLESLLAEKLLAGEKSEIEISENLMSFALSEFEAIAEAEVDAIKLKDVDRYEEVFKSFF